MIGSGPMGEHLAIDYLEMVGGCLVIAGMSGAALTAMNSLHTKPNFTRAGRALIAFSLTATCVYMLGLIGAASGWLAPTMFHERFVENLAGSLLAATIGIAVTQLDKLYARIGPQRDRIG